MQKIILRYDENIPSPRTFLERLGDEYDGPLSPPDSLKIIKENNYFPITHIHDKKSVDQIIGRIDSDGYYLLFVDASESDGGKILYARKNEKHETVPVL